MNLVDSIGLGSGQMRTRPRSIVKESLSLSLSSSKVLCHRAIRPRRDGNKRQIPSQQPFRWQTKGCANDNPTKWGSIHNKKRHNLYMEISISLSERPSTEIVTRSRLNCISKPTEFFFQINKIQGHRVASIILFF